MSQNTQKEKWSDLIIAVLGVIICLLCIIQVPKAWEKEEQFKQERVEIFLADEEQQAVYAVKKGEVK